MTPANIADYYTESHQFLEKRKRRQVSQLVLLNNLERGDQNIASTLLLTLFTRLVSSLYDDKMQVKFLPSQGINQEQLNAYNILAQSDYQEMGKARLDYDWVWDTLFFGRGYLETIRFDKRRKIMQPHVINPLMFGYDPYYEEVQDWRYYWKWLTKNKWELEKLIKAGIITGVKKVSEIPSGVEAQLWEYKIKRDQAKKGIEPSSDSKGEVFQILEFFGYNEKGEKSVYWTDKNISVILMESVLDLQDGTPLIAPNGKEIETGSKWPIIVKESFREPHSSIPFSVADILEDKHRAKSVLLNLAYIAAKDRANPIYGYIPDQIQDLSQFFSRQINQHIPMDSPDAVFPLNTEDPMSDGLLKFINVLTEEANAPMGTGTVLQPDKGGPQTATERAIDQQLNDMAQSLQSKVMQFGEQEFWSHWFHRYRRYGKELGTKMANIVGVKGVDSTEVDLKDFQTTFPPGVLVFSAKEAEFKELVKKRDFQQDMPLFMQILDPDGMKNFLKHVYLPLTLEDPSLINIMLPKDIDEMKAEKENAQLERDELPEVKDTDNHATHIYTHMMVQPKTKAVWFHIAEHEEKLAEQKAEEQAIQQQQAQQIQQTQQPRAPQVGADKKNPLEAASPLKTEMQSTNQSIKNNVKSIS